MGQEIGIINTDHHSGFQTRPGHSTDELPVSKYNIMVAVEVLSYQPKVEQASSTNDECIIIHWAARSSLDAT